MARSAPNSRSTPTDGPPPVRTITVGRPLQARLIALEKRLGAFSEEPSFADDSRFNHPVLLPAESPVPEGMRQVFGGELAALERLAGSTVACNQVRLGDYTASCVTAFQYDGFRVLVHVEHDSTLVAAWSDEEVLHPDSPRRMLSTVPDSRIEAFLQAVEGK